MADSKADSLDPFVRNRVFPEPQEVFAFAPVSLSEALEGGAVVLDTNTLLIPYSAGRASLEHIARTYRTLANEHRLKVPAQVAREFAGHRAEKCKTLYQQLSQKRNVSIKPSEYPLLEGSEAYARLKRAEKALEHQLQHYRSALADTLGLVRGWRWDDPVSRLYREIFSAEVIVDSELNASKTLEEVRYRQDHSIPPGYRDRGNDFGGVGDVLIWQTILDIGSREKRHLVFVSGEEKSDWFYKSENDVLYPRFELLDEYRRASGGRTLHVVSLAVLLEHLGASQAVVKDVRLEEVASAQEAAASNVVQTGRFSEWSEHAVLVWLFQQHPGAVIKRNRAMHVDFVVETSEGPLAFEVKTLSGTRTVRGSLLAWLAQLRDTDWPARSLNLVVVCGSSRLAHSIELAVQDLREAPPVRSIVIGLLVESGSFVEQRRFLYSYDSSGGHEPPLA